MFVSWSDTFFDNNFGTKTDVNLKTKEILKTKENLKTFIYRSIDKQSTKNLEFFVLVTRPIG